MSKIICDECAKCHWYSDDVLEECQGKDEPCHEFSVGIEYKNWKLKGEANGWMEKVSPSRDSDDLISRKDFITEIEINIGNIYNPDIIKGMRFAIDLINSRPTAFDKEKVIMEMKKYSHNFYPSIDHYCLSQKAVDLKKAIEIIEKGGVA